MHTSIHVIGMGLEGASGLSPDAYRQIHQAEILVGAQRHLAHFPDAQGERWSLDDLQAILTRLQAGLQQVPPPQVAVLTSGDPLFFGLGRLLLGALPANALTFYPHLSAMQLAFSRLKLPWQDACFVSVHGRSWEALIAALKRSESKIAILTDPLHGPMQIAEVLRSQSLPIPYTLWVCENLGGPDELITTFAPHEIEQLAQAASQTWSALNMVILVRQSSLPPAESSPLIGIPDHHFASFPDQPGLITKREIRALVLSELALMSTQQIPDLVIWDIGAGTGSVSIELARLVSHASIYAIEQTALGIQLIQTNCQRFGIGNIHPVAQAAPPAFTDLPAPHRVFIGGSGGQLAAILSAITLRLHDHGVVVAALATLESTQTWLHWLASQPDQHWQCRYLHLQVSRSVRAGRHTRFNPLNPVTLATLSRTTQN
jgi:precorrin-6B C5,15-methyltransferase / cobalt-precorrin-6B C5,C15-methyltransferase